MATPSESCAMQEEMETVLVTLEDTVLEEIDGDQTSLTYGKPPSLPGTPEPQQRQSEQPISPESPTKTRRDFGNISPISELLDDDDLEDVASIEIETGEELIESMEDNGGKVTPEPGSQPSRASFPRISDGRSSPILAFSPSLIKSPSSNGSKPRVQQSSPSSGGSGGGGGGVGKRPRNIARMLDNISDHSSGEEEVNSVGVMMAKFTVQ